MPVCEIGVATGVVAFSSGQARLDVRIRRDIPRVFFDLEEAGANV